MTISLLRDPWHALVTLSLPSAVVVVVVTLLTGCASPVVRSVAARGTDSEAGIAYYLPKRLMKVTFTREPAPTEQQVKEAKDSLDAAKKALDTAKKEAKAAQNLLDAIPSTPENAAARDRQNIELQLAKGREKLVTTSFDQSNVEYEVLRAAAQNKTHVDKFLLATLPPVADARYRYWAQPNHETSRNDRFNLKTNTSGLLTGTAATAEDKTAEIISQLAGFIAAVATGGPLAPVRITMDRKPVAVAATKPCPDVERVSVEFVIDPVADISATPLAKGFERNPFEKKLCAVGADYLIRRSPAIAPSEPPTADSAGQPICGNPEGRVANARACGAGLYYRRELPYVFSISRITNDAKGNEEFATVNEFFGSFPNGSPAEFIAMDASTFVTTSYTTTFDNGMLVEYASDKPSEALAIAKLPIQVLSAIFSIPADLLTLRINYVNKEKDYAGAEKALLDALKALEQARSASGGAASP